MSVTIARILDWCWWVSPARLLRVGLERLFAPLLRREARSAILQIEQDIAMIAPLRQPDMEARLRQIQDGWVRRLTELGGK